MGDSLFASEPIYFRMDRKSREALMLREAVAKKLLDFLGNYSDDVLAEYIVVLVCNGKHQNQARDDLQAFLGEESGAFVAWLWDYLSKEFISKLTPEFSALEAKVSTNCSNSLDREYKNRMIAEHDTRSVGPPNTKNASLELPSSHANADHMNPLQVADELQTFFPNLNERSAAVNMEKLKVPEIALCKNSGSKNGSFTSAAKGISSSIMCSNEVSPGNKQPLQFELQNQKIPTNSSSTVPSSCLLEPKTDQTAICLRSMIADDRHLRPSSSKNFTETRPTLIAMNDSSHQAARLRRNVWDRLGRPQVEDQRPIKEPFDYLDIIDSGKLDHHGEEPQNSRLTRISSVTNKSSSLNRQSYAVDGGDAEGISFKHSDEFRTSDKVVGVSTLKRKRETGGPNTTNGLFSKENCVQDKELSQHQQHPFLVKQNSQQSMNKFSRVTDRLVAFDAKFGSINSAYAESDSKDIVVSQSQETKNSSSSPKEKLVPASTTLPANSKSQSITDGRNANQKPVQEDVLAVKSRLRQIEMAMLKLRSKHMGQSNNGKQNSSTALQNLREEGIESRTVLVTNVHFAATRESLISHFGKCGTIAKIIMLTDAVTALPKGAAYIVFAHNESVDKAISLSGTSFFSRILKVIRKAEVPPDFLVPSQPTSKQAQSFSSQHYGKFSMQTRYTSSHLQWKRDQRSSGENS